MFGMFEMIVVACSVVGIAAAARIAMLIVHSKRVSPLEMTKIGTTALAISAAASCLLESSSPLLWWMNLNLPIFAAALRCFLLAKSRDRQFHERLEDGLMSTIVLMREGHSLRGSIELQVASAPPSMRPYLVEVHRSVSFSPQETECNRPISLPIAEIAREFRRIEGLKQSQLVELERWRKRLRAQKDFRRRSGQATAQVRVQASVLVILFVGLAVFSGLGFGWRDTGSALRLAIPLFMLGLLWIWRGGRRVRWSV